jgi:hypothetical protein
VQCITSYLIRDKIKDHLIILLYCDFNVAPFILVILVSYRIREMLYTQFAPIEIYQRSSAENREDMS